MREASGCTADITSASDSTDTPPSPQGYIHDSVRRANTKAPVSVSTATGARRSIVVPDTAVVRRQGCQTNAAAAPTSSPNERVTVER